MKSGRDNFPKALHGPLIIIYVRSGKLIIPSGFIGPNNDPAAVNYPELIIPSGFVGANNFTPLYVYTGCAKSSR